jgi:hypothetical protein
MIRDDDNKPELPPHIPGSTCGAETSNGGACRWPASEGGNGKCWRHAPELEGVRMAHLAVTSARGGRITAQVKRAERAEFDKVKDATLRTADDLLSALERALRRVECASAEKATERAKTVASIVEKAAAILARSTEAENAELRALIAEKHPDLARRLKIV